MLVWLAVAVVVLVVAVLTWLASSLALLHNDLSDAYELVKEILLHPDRGQELAEAHMRRKKEQGRWLS